MKQLTSQEYYNKVHGSWLGRIAGDFVGAPVEFKPYKYIKLRYGNIDYYPKPVDLDYVNDDEMYEICALLALEKNGYKVTNQDIAYEWVNGLYTQNFTAEKIALKNLRMGIKPPTSGTYKNIFYDAIGAQMRGDIWGQITPGCPDMSKYYAEMDGSISHAGIGIQGEVFIAVLISQAFFENNITKNIKMALKYIPPAQESIYAQMVKKSMDIYKDYPNDFRDARKALMSYWKKVRWSQLIKKEPLLSSRNILFLNKIISGVHVLPNIGIIILSLLYGKEDEVDPLGKSICIAAMMGLDADCNCGNIGAILGTQLGETRILKKWKYPLRNTFSTYVKGYKKWEITELAKRVSVIGKEIIKNQECDKVEIIESV